MNRLEQEAAACSAAMSVSARSRYERWVRTLAAFGHRGSATDHEAQAANYLVEELTHLGLEPAKGAFHGSRSAGLQFLLPVLVAGIGASVLWHLPVFTALLGMIGLISFVLEQSSRVTLLRRFLPTSPSCNVVARIPVQAGNATRRVVVCGHYDTQRTGLLWNSSLVKRIAPVLTKSPGLIQSPAWPLVLAMVMQLLVSMLALWWPGTVVVSILGVTILGIYVVSGLLLAEWAVGPYVPGASDNASGAAAVVSLAEAWLESPINEVELVILLTGCEETGLLGAAAWAEAHGKEIRTLPTTFLNLDTLGSGRPRFLEREHSNAGILVDYPAEIVDACRQVATERGLVDAGPHSIPVATDGLAFLVRGILGMNIISFEDGGHVPHYHLLTDTADRMNFDVAWAAVEFSWAVLRRLAMVLTVENTERRSESS